MHVFQTAKTQATSLGLLLEPLGGGRIQYIPGSAAADGRDDAASDAIPRVPRWEAAGAHDAFKGVSDGVDGGAERGSRCLIYGYSSAFGVAPHELSASIVRRWHPFADVVVAYEGY
jgi:hypothetical protein